MSDCNKMTKQKLKRQNKNILFSYDIRETEKLLVREISLLPGIEKGNSKHKLIDVRIYNSEKRDEEEYLIPTEQGFSLHKEKVVEICKEWSISVPLMLLLLKGDDAMKKKIKRNLIKGRNS